MCANYMTFQYFMNWMCRFLSVHKFESFSESLIAI